jgi:hypothetical protein
MKTVSELGIPSKISLLKDLSRYLGGPKVFGTRLAPPNLEIVKELKCPPLLSNS